MTKVLKSGYTVFDMAITIRTASIRDGHLIVQAGAGIVADSVPATEHAESLNKARAMEKALNLIASHGREESPCSL